MPTRTIRFDRVVPEGSEIEVKGMPLGRTFINHDSESWRYRVGMPPAGVISISHKWMIPTLDQGNVGSCTGNGSVHQIGCSGQHETFAAAWPDCKLDEKDALGIYSLATKLDPYTGTYPPTDTGSDGLSAGKAAVQDGYAAGYEHAMSTDDIIAGLQVRAGMVGTQWTSNMDSPDSKTGVIRKPQSGTVRGGHEYCVSLVDLERGLFGFRQSWGDWGVADPETGMMGRFYMQIEDFAELLKKDGDATFFTPLGQPAPTPTPPNEDTVTRTYSTSNWADVQAWVSKPHIWRLATKAAAVVRD